MKEMSSVCSEVDKCCCNLDVIRKTKLGRRKESKSNSEKQEGKRFLTLAQQKTMNPLQCSGILILKMFLWKLGVSRDG